MFGEFKKPSLPFALSVLKVKACRRKSMTNDSDDEVVISQTVRELGKVNAWKVVLEMVQ